MVDLRAVPLPLYLALLVCLLPVLIGRLLYRRFITRPILSPNLSPTSYTPLPSSLVTPPLSIPYSHHFIQTPSSRVHYVRTSNSPSPTSTIPLLFVHGFPEWWYGWRRQLEHFAASHRCLAIDLRGFGYSEVAGVKVDPSLYSIVHQCRDVVAVLDAEKVERVLIVGHDWGGAVAWNFARRYPDRLHGVASLCTFYRPITQPPPLLQLLRILPNFSYMLFFAFARDTAARNFEEQLEATFSLFFSSSQPEEGRTLGLIKIFSALALLPGLPFHVKRSKLWTAAELKAYCDMYRWSGFKYPLLWYRTLRLNGRQAMKTEASLGLPPLGSSPQPSGPLSERISVPALMMPAEKDPILQPALCDGMEKWCDDLTRVDIRGAGHWAQLEQPTQVNTALTAFIEQLQTKKAKRSLL
jgi:soluble epoxide hydrolase/lipid-phosphate phosphatase